MRSFILMIEEMPVILSLQSIVSYPTLKNIFIRKVWCWFSEYKQRTLIILYFWNSDTVTAPDVILWCLTSLNLSFFIKLARPLFFK